MCAAKSPPITHREILLLHYDRKRLRVERKGGRARLDKLTGSKKQEGNGNGGSRAKRTKKEPHGEPEAI